VGKRLVWTSSNESVERGIPSVLAIAETVAVVARGRTPTTRNKPIVETRKM
jgi:hypothetical protein